MARIYHTWHGFYPSTFASLASLDCPALASHARILSTNDYNFGNSVSDTPFSIAVWFKVDNLSLAGAQGLITKGEFSSGTLEYVIEIVRANSNISFFLFDGVGGLSSRLNATTPAGTVANATWAHLVVTYDGSALASGIKIYINGSSQILSTSSAGSYTAMGDKGGIFGLGRSWNSTSFIGNIDNLAFYDKELSAAEALECYNAGSPIDHSATSMAANLYDNFEFENSYTSGVLGNTLTPVGGTTFSTDVP